MLQLTKANSLAEKDGTNLSAVIQYLIDKAETRDEPPVPAWRIRIQAEQVNADARKQAILAFHSLPPEEKRRLNTPYVAQLRAEIEAGKLASPEEIALADAEMLLFMRQMNESRISRGAEPLYDLK